MLGIPEDRVRVVQSTTGGGFGGKARCYGRALPCVGSSLYEETRYHAIHPRESFLSNTKRHPLYIEYKTGAKKDGSIQAIKVNIIGDTGPYISYGETVCLRVAVHSTGPYEVPNVYTDSRMFYTNNPVCGAMRGLVYLSLRSPMSRKWMRSRVPSIWTLWIFVSKTDCGKALLLQLPKS